MRETSLRTGTELPLDSYFKQNWVRGESECGFILFVFLFFFAEVGGKIYLHLKWQVVAFLDIYFLHIKSNGLFC